MWGYPSPSMQPLGSQWCTFPWISIHFTDSYSPYLGPAKLGTPYCPDPAYIKYFAQFANANNLEDCKIYPEMLLIASSKLEIIIENVHSVSLLASILCFFLFNNQRLLLFRLLDHIPCLGLPWLRIVVGQGMLNLLKGSSSHWNWRL